MTALFIRSQRNPIVTAADVPYPCHAVFNPGACKFGNQYLLLLRVEDRRGVSHLTLARSGDGERFTVDARPWIEPSTDPAFELYERFGVEDPRITKIDDTYYITYTAYGPHGPRGGLGWTKDFISFTRGGFPTEIDNKDLVLFPKQIAGRYAMLDRPGGYMGQGASIWMQLSPDLRHWGDARVVLSPTPVWGMYKIGAGPPPIETERGWLVLYHGVRVTEGGKIYRAGLALLDLEDPTMVIARDAGHVFAPEAPYERQGDVPNVVFPTGLILEADGTVLMYYGAADTRVAMARASLDDLVTACRG